jgi:hypothetical protein
MKRVMNILGILTGISASAYKTEIGAPKNEFIHGLGA